MATRTEEKRQGIGFFERYPTAWVLLCIDAGIVLGRLAPGVARSLDRFSICVGEAPMISVPIAVCLFFMMYPPGSLHVCRMHVVQASGQEVVGST